MVVVMDASRHKYVLLGPTGMNVMGTLIPFAYGTASAISGLWHVINIANGSESGVSFLLLQTLDNIKNFP
jgi:hypothetical protein